MTNDEKLERAKTLLTLFEENLQCANEIHETVSGDWGLTDKGYRKMPPLLRTSLSWKDAVDPEKLKQVATLVSFLKQAIFGVDCDNDSAVQFRFVDQARDQARIPPFVVARVDENSSLKEIMTALNCARTNAKISQRLVEEIERELNRKLEEQFKQAEQAEQSEEA